MSSNEVPVLGEECYPDFSFPWTSVSIPDGFPESWPFNRLIQKLTDRFLMLFVSVTW